MGLKHAGKTRPDVSWYQSRHPRGTGLGTLGRCNRVVVPVLLQGLGRVGSPSWNGCGKLKFQKKHNN